MNPELNKMNINQIIINIDRTVNSDSKYYGKLVKWQDPQNNNQWSYGIGLSDEEIFDTSQNLTIIKTNVPIFIVNHYHQNFSQDEIIERLKYALLYNSEKQIKFDDKSWNDEHFARLIVTNDAISYKVSKNFRNNNKYQKEINSYIQQINPELYLNNYNFFVPNFWTILKYDGLGFKDKKFWNWLELLIIPTLLALGALFFEVQADQRTEDSDDKRAAQQSLEEYLKTVQEIVTSSKPSTEKENERSTVLEKLSYEEKAVIESFTELVLSEIDGNQKSQVVKLLYDLELINCNGGFCETINLDGVDLTEANLSNLDLRNINLKGANLKNALLIETNLELANLENSNLENADFKLARIKNATMSNAFFGVNQGNSGNNKKFAMMIPFFKSNKDNVDSGEKWKKVIEITSLYYLSESDSLNTQNYCNSLDKNNSNNSNEKLDFTDLILSNANLEKLDLREADFTGADLRGVSLKGSNLENANLKKAKLDNIELEGAYLRGIQIDKNSEKKLKPKEQLVNNLVNNKINKINLSYKDLSNSDLTNITLKEIKAQEANLTNTKLICSELIKLDLSNSNLYDADLTGVEIKGGTLNKANLNSTNLSQADLSHLDLTDASLFAANLSNITINNTILNEADLNSANLSGANLSNVDLTDADLYKVNLRGASINVNLERANLSNADLSGANLLNAQNLDKAELEGAIYDNETKFPDSFNPENSGMISIAKKQE